MPTARGPDPAVEEHFLGALYRGGELLASGKIIEAREHLEKAYRLEPKNEKAQNLLGLTYFKLGLFDLAAQVYEQLVLENPADPTLRVNLGLVYLKTNDLERSIKEFETGTDLEPGHKKAHNYLGLALAQKGDYARAREHFLLAGSDQMAEKMERALEARGSVSSATRDGSLTPMLPPEAIERPMPPLSSPPGPPPPPPPDAEETAVMPEGRLEELAPDPMQDAAVEPPSEVDVQPPALTSDWGEHVPDPSPSVPEFTIVERLEAHGPEELQFTEDGGVSAFAMNDAPLVPLDAPLEPVDVRLEGLPTPTDPLPVLESGAVELVAAESTEPLAQEPSIWLTEHVAGVPLGTPSPMASSPAPLRWDAPTWVESPEAAAGPQWAPAQGEATMGWLNDAQPPQEGPAASMWPSEGSPTPVDEAWAPEERTTQPLPSFSEAVDQPVVEDVAPPGEDPGLEPLQAQGGDGPAPDWNAEALEATEAPTPPEPQGDESNWVMQPVSEAFAAEAPAAPLASPPPPYPQPSSGFMPMPARRLAELGQTTPWVHESGADPFQLGPEGLAVTVAGEMLLRMEGLVAVVGSLTVEPEGRRRRGRPTAEPFGEGPGQLHRARGHGVVYLEGAGGFHSLDLSDQPTSSIDDEGAYLREELVFAFEEAVSFDNGRLTDESGLSVELVHLKGHGKVLLSLDGALRAMPIPLGTPTMVPLNRLVGWFGRVTPRLVGLGSQGAVELTGDGFALLLTPA